MLNTNNTTIDKILFVFVTLIVLNYRPGILGEHKAEYLFFILCNIFMLFLVKNKFKLSVNKNQIITFIFIFLFNLYILFQMTFMGEYSSLRPVINSFVLIVFSSIILLLFLSNCSNIDIILRTIVITMLLLSISQVVTYILLNIFPEPKLILANIRTHELWFSADYAKLYFPFTIMTTSKRAYPFLNYSFRRSFGFFREPGIYQMYINVAYFSLDFIKIKRKFLIQAFLIFSLIMTFSTAGYVIFTVVLCYKLLIKYIKQRISLKKMLFAFVSVIFIIFIGYYSLTATDYGLTSKLEGPSGSMRLIKILDGFRYLLKYPIFGTGYSNTITGPTFSFLARLYTIGIVGIFLYFMCWFSGVFVHFDYRKFTISIPILLTLLFAQPIFNDFIIYFFLLLNTRRLQQEKDVSVKIG